MNSAVSQYRDLIFTKADKADAPTKKKPGLRFLIGILVSTVILVPAVHFGIYAFYYCRLLVSGRCLPPLLGCLEIAQ